MSKFKIPSLLIISPIIALPIWYYMNTDKIGTILFGEKLNYCGVIGCEVTRTRFTIGALLLVGVFAAGIIMLFIRTRKPKV